MPTLSVSVRRSILLWVLLVVAVAARAVEAQNPDLTFHPVTPCTVVDTRTGSPFAPSEIRTYNVVGGGSLASQGGSATGCGIPGFSNGIAQVQAVALVFTSIIPAGAGHVTAHAADQPLAGSVLNYAAGNTLTNTTQVAVAQTSGVGDFKVQVAVSSTHLLIRAVGYYSKPVQTVHVHPVPGNHTASGTALLSAINGITNASATKRYVVKLEPGIYDVGGTKLLMKPYVDIEGSGQEATVIQGLGNNDGLFETGVIEGAASAELRHLQVKVTGSVSQPYAIAFFSPPNTDTRLRNVTLAASGGDLNWGIRAPGGSPVVEECTIRAQGGSISHGLAGRTTSRPIIKRTLIEVTNGSSASYGMIFVNGSAPLEIRDVQIRLTGAGTSAYGISVDQPIGGPVARITNSTVDVDGATTTRGIRFRGLRLNVEQSQIRATGSSSIGVDTFTSETVIDHSEITGETSTVEGFNAYIGASRLNGGPVSAGATCAGVYDESFTFFAGPACP